LPPRPEPVIFYAGLGLEFIIVTSVVLGGVSMAGGEGGLLGIVLGVLTLGITDKGLRLAQVYIYPAVGHYRVSKEKQS
jgi:ribose/xylose/arabinose/galactoside ABC-type transport system permease subunit